MSLQIIENAKITGITASGALLLDGGGVGYRIEIGEDGVDLLVRLLSEYLRRVEGAELSKIVPEPKIGG